MQSVKAKRRWIAIAALGVLCVGGALGVRQFYRKSIYGNWVGYIYYMQEGKMQRDMGGGQFVMALHDNGMFEENGNETSGTFAKKGDQLVLTPMKFRGQTPEEVRVRYHTKDGKLRTPMRLLLNRIMKPMKVSYEPSKDQIIYVEDTLTFIFDRMD
jgi:hypothetical protein